MKKLNKQTLSLVLLLVLGLIWGSSFIFIKYTIYTIPPISAVLLRMFVAAICLFVYIKVSKIELPYDKEAVKNYLVTLGVGDSRISSVSYGKERPAVVGSNDGAWSQNRRSVTKVN